MDSDRLCDVCGRSFFPEEKVTRRFGIWADETPTTCDDCLLDKEFPNEENDDSRSEIEDDF